MSHQGRGLHKLAQKLHDEFPDTPTLTLARRLYKENSKDFPSLEAARNSLRYVRGTTGKHNRQKRGLKAPLKKGYAGQQPALPPTEAKEWKPVVLKLPCKVLCLSDLHIPYHSEIAVNAAVEWGMEHQPDVIVLNGDVADFYTISRWEKDPNARNFVAETDAIEQTLEWLQRCFPDARKIYMEGNHEERYTKYIWQKAPELWGVDNVRIQEILHVADYGFEYIDGRRPVMAGKMCIMHGHEINAHGGVNPARTAFLRTSTSVLIGHLHRTSTHAESDMWHSETVTFSQGCLCDLRPEYCRVSNKWNWGFAFVAAEKDGQFDVTNLRISKQGHVRTA